MPRHEWPNQDPIDDVYVVLDLLTSSWGDATIRTLYQRDSKRRDDAWRKDYPSLCEDHVEVGVYTSGYTKEEWTSSTHFRVTRRVIKELRERGFVKGKPQWGYTDANEMRATRLGQEFFWDRLKELDGLNPNGLRSEDWFEHIGREPWAR